MVKSINIDTSLLQFEAHEKEQRQIIIENTGDETVTFSDFSCDLDSISIEGISSLSASELLTAVNFPENSRTLPPRIKMLNENKGVISYRGYSDNYIRYCYFDVDSAGVVTKGTERAITAYNQGCVLPLDANFALVLHYHDTSKEVNATIYEVSGDELVNPGASTLLTTDGYFDYAMEAFMIDQDLKRVLCSFEHYTGGAKVGLQIVDCDTTTKTVTAYTRVDISSTEPFPYSRTRLKNSSLGLVVYRNTASASNVYLSLFSISETTITVGNTLASAGNAPNINKDAAFINDNKILVSWSPLTGSPSYSVFSYSGITITEAKAATAYTDAYSGMHTLFLSAANEITLLYGKNLSVYSFSNSTNTLTLLRTETSIYSFTTIYTYLNFANIDFPETTGNVLICASTSTDGVDIVSRRAPESGIITINYADYGEKPRNGTITIESDATSSPDEVAIEITLSMKQIDAYNYITPCPVRWDWLSYNFYGSFDYVEQLMEANKHVSYYWRKALFLPSGTKLIIPTLEEIKASVASSGSQSATIENFPSFVG